MPIICTFVLGDIAKELNLKVMLDFSYPKKVSFGAEYNDKYLVVVYVAQVVFYILRQTLSFDSAVSIPFSDLYRALRLLFPHEDAIVHFYV